MGMDYQTILILYALKNTLIIVLLLNNKPGLGDLFGMWEDVLYCRLHFELVAATYGPHGDPLDLPPSLQSPTGNFYL